MERACVTEEPGKQQARQAQQSSAREVGDAQSVGYESDAAFSKAFKRVVGVSPGEYVKRGSQEQVNGKLQHSRSSGA